MTPTAALALRAQVHGAVSATVEAIDGRSVVVVRTDPAVRRGALTIDDGATIAAAARLARTERIPLVIWMSSSGADVHDGVAALHGWGSAARELVRCSGVVPIVLVAHGPAVSGPALLLGLADLVVMTPDAYAFLSGPRMVTAFTGVPISLDALGGPDAHNRRSGVAALMAADELAAAELVAAVLSYLPSHNDEEPPSVECDDPLDRPTPEVGGVLPAASTGSYDVRHVIEPVVDESSFLELHPAWAANLVTGFATVGGRPIGVVANQPMNLAGTLDIPASQKGARFVAFCDAFNLPLLTLVDTTGFFPGKDLEWRGMIRKGAQLAFAYARASVPRVSITLRKSYGGAYIVMDSKRMGCDLCLAWPTAEIAVMGAKPATEVLHRRADAETRAAYERDYDERFLNPYVASERGLVDAVIDPAETRVQLAGALETLSLKRERLAPRAHDNTPL
jgi:acetyl-CoA carboxylase carboxyltransferase component